ncbi:Tungsten-containing aldehyde:ferredoxin oxidoreductase (EC [Olavius sp. associated proteobacterium Delta 1]|nr:Tungsten-containing aldehyde:ferredoxin oxidoreductase (EC [Olavius sp. associated proteobacterium Delta 1]
MANGYMGNLLNVHLAEGKISDEKLSDELCNKFIGGYGLGARLLYDRIPAGADPLGPDNILGILTGPLTGTPAVIGSRFVVVAKSPKTAGGWGDANCGGHFGPHLKFAGYDGILFYGISSKLVYLVIDEGKPELLDATDLAGMGVTPLEDLLKKRHGADCEVCSIGPAGEKLALTSCIMNDKERAAGRSGLGAVMGSKKIKAVVVKGKMKVPLNDEAGMKDLKKKILKQAGGGYQPFNKYGTAGFTHDSVISGDGPVKNWGGAGTTDFPSEQARKISDDAVIGVEGYKPYGCWRCPVACGGRMSQKSGKFALEFNDGVGHKPEYETLAMYGSNLLNDDLPSIIKVNEICNNLGLDTIAAGATIGYAIECYENGLLSKAQTDGMELTWGNAEAIVALTEKMGRREGLGDILADGVAAAWEKLGKIGTEYAVHVQGEEMPAHDPKFIPGLATTYLVTATPARHTQGGELLTPVGFDEPQPDKYSYSGQADIHSKLVAIYEVVNAAGLCMFGTLCYPIQSLPEQLSVATGQEYDMEKIYQIGMRIYTMRHAFNLREGLNPLTRNVPGRMIGDPPLKEGNVRDITVDYKLLIKEYLEQIGWDTSTSVPTDETLRKLDLDFLIEDLRKVDP